MHGRNGALAQQPVQDGVGNVVWQHLRQQEEESILSMAMPWSCVQVHFGGGLCSPQAASFAPASTVHSQLPVTAFSLAENRIIAYLLKASLEIGAGVCPTRSYLHADVHQAWDCHHSTA